MKNLKLELLQTELIRVTGWIKFSDKKSGFLFLYYSAIFTLLVSYKNNILHKLLLYENYKLLIYFTLVICSIIFLLLGLYFLISCVFPRNKNKNTDKSLFFFGSVARYKLIDFLDTAKNVTEEEVKKQLLEQIHSNSIIANTKFNNVKYSTICLSILSVIIIIISLI